ncbi:DUF397 domain-containing protein [Spirillospora sp. NPDC029432]|uniref:DUF397 domain-containing protein n=1 Tax=Spirillospora sp. NPDC029432 TaxID=3154599 RepID=UPI0034556A7E
MIWRKSSRSKEDGSNCVEVASVANAIVVHDSKDPCGPMLVVERGEFRRLVQALKRDGGE